MKAAIVWLVELLTFNRVRGQHNSYPCLRWWWTPWTYHCMHSGWFYLSIPWMRRYWRASQRRGSE